MDQTTALVVGGSFQTSYADDVVTASNGPACTSASANPACAAATSACALTTAAWRVATTACARRTEKYACAAVSAALWRAWASEASADDTAASACLIWYRAWRLSSSSDADTLTLLLVAVGPTVVVSEEFP